MWSDLSITKRLSPNTHIRTLYSHSLFYQKAAFSTGRINRGREIRNTGMSFLVSVATHPSADIAKPSLFLEDRSSGDRTIIGNVPAGLQRKCNDMKLRTSRLTNIFLSGIVDWKSLSGLPGLILTISDQGVKSLGIYHSGNRVIQYMISCWRYFIFRFGMDVDVKDVNSDIEKGHVVYTPINISPENDYGNNDGKNDDHERLDYLVKNIFPLQQDRSKPLYNSKRINNVTLPKSIVNPKVTTNWIFTPVPIRGKFMVQKAKELNCEVKHYSLLCNHKEVTLVDGTIVRPEQVLEPTRYFNPSLVLDIPAEEYLNKIINHDWMSVKPNHLPYGVIFHFIDESIADPLSRPEYINFINSFGPSTLHLISHSSYCPNTVNFMRSFKYSLKLKTLMNNLFPLPKWSNDAVLNLDGKLPNVIPMMSGQKINIKAAEGTVLDEATRRGDEICQFDLAQCDKIYDTEIKPFGFKNMLTKGEFDSMLENRYTVQTLRKSVDPTKALKDQVETLILGTGSAIPASHKNVLCNLVRIPYILGDGSTGYRTIVLDAGENSFGSLKRIYKQEEVDMLLDEMNMIYLSHLHADHHLGIVDFIREWNYRQDLKFGNERSEILTVITPWQYEFFVEELNKVDQFVNTQFLKYVSCEEFMMGQTSPSTQQFEIENFSMKDLNTIPNVEVEFVKNEERRKAVYHDLGLRDIKTCNAFHCEFSYSVTMTFKLDLNVADEKDVSNIFRLSYSGDTRPKAQFSFMGTDTDLLIHESTLEDEKFRDALDKRHSTTSEAIQVGILMKAKKIILTHFSQRYKSFTCSELVYKRLENPTTKDDIINSGHAPIVPPDSPSAHREFYTAINENPEIPIELKSPIFVRQITKDIALHAKDIDVLFAFDNMKVQYDEFSQQRKIFEAQGEKLESFFFADEQDIDVEVPDDSEPVKKNKKKEKGKKPNANANNNGNGNYKANSKKRKVSPLPF